MILTDVEHQTISKALGEALPPGEIEDMTRKELLEAYKAVYKKLPAWLAEVKRYFK